MTVWKKAMSYLGLGPDDAYDDYDLPPEPERPPLAHAVVRVGLGSFMLAVSEGSHRRDADMRPGACHARS